MRAGKVRALGVSNFPAWLLAWAVALQDRDGWSPFVSLQPQYSLVERTIELELLPFCRAAGLGVMPWVPLGAGFLTGVRGRRGPPEGTRIADASDDVEEALRSAATVERNFRVVDAAAEIAEAHGATSPPGRACVADRRPTGVTAPIVGPRTLERLEGVLDSSGRAGAHGRRAGPSASTERHYEPPASATPRG